MNHPKLRDSYKLADNNVYEIGNIPEPLIMEIGAHIIYLVHIGRIDMTGDDWGDIFADSINGTHFSSPIGIADVGLGKMAWSMKTVKNAHPFDCNNVRLISGRCSPDYSFGISNPHEDIQKTGQSVLAVWNERISIAYDNYNHVRVNVLVRNNDLTEFCMFEEFIERYKTSDYIWKENKNGNLIGVNKYTGKDCFTWQPHGSQFTIHTRVPDDAVKFKLRKPPVIQRVEALNAIGFDKSWIQIVK